MKRNMFGEVIIQPGDDPTALWHDVHAPEEDPRLEAFDINNEDAYTLGWTCTLRNADNWDQEMQVHDFPTREALVSFLESHCVEIEYT